MNLNLWKLDDHSELVEALFAAHREAAIANDNASKLCVQQAWGGSGRFENAIISGMATIGALHAPLRAARELWEADECISRVRVMLTSGEKVPGFGNSFFPNKMDPAFHGLWSEIDDAYCAYPKERDRLLDLVDAVHSSGRPELWPNAALLTAIVASICEVPIGLEPALFAMARIPAWAEMCGAVQHPKVGGLR